MILTKCILKLPSLEDGLRISVMSRHTLNDGVTPDNRIQQCDFHIPMFGPDSKLIGSYLRGDLNWDFFRREYLTRLKSNSRAIRKLKIFILLSLDYNITFLCVEDTPDFCHRRLLAEECQRIDGRVQIRHL